MESVCITEYSLYVVYSTYGRDNAFVSCVNVISCSTEAHAERVFNILNGKDDVTVTRLYGE